MTVHQAHESNFVALPSVHGFLFHICVTFFLVCLMCANTFWGLEAQNRHKELSRGIFRFFIEFLVAFLVPMANCDVFGRTF